VALASKVDKNSNTEGEANEPSPRLPKTGGRLSGTPNKKTRHLLRSDLRLDDDTF
jgi:hypothetical protein